MDEQVASVEKELDEKLANFGVAKGANALRIKNQLKRQRLRQQTVGNPGMELREPVKYARNSDLFVSHGADHFSTGIPGKGKSTK